MVDRQMQSSVVGNFLVTAKMTCSAFVPALRRRERESRGERKTGEFATLKST